MLGAVVVRLAVAALLGARDEDVRLDRRCPSCGGPHGPVRVPGGGAEVSVSHGGDWVVVAVSDVPLGVDVEPVDAGVDTAAIVDQVLAPEERAALDRLDDGARVEAFFRCWTRKEAVLKSTRRGLLDPMTDVVVSAPGAAPRVLRVPAGSDNPARPTDPAGFVLRDLADRPGHVGALAVRTRDDVRVVERSATSIPGWPGVAVG